MADRTGLEPATPGVTGRYSNQLNYRPAKTGLSRVMILSALAEKMLEKVVGGTGVEPVTYAL